MSGTLENMPDPAAPVGTRVGFDPGARPDTTLDWAALAPPLFLSLLLVILDGAASWRVPLREVIPWLYLPSLLAVGLYLLFVCRLRCRPFWFVFAVVLAFLAIYLPMANFFGRWLPDPVHGISLGFDDWCYQSFGDYLFNNPRGRVDGMSMLDEFGAHLQDSRFSAPGLLSLLGSEPPFKDPPMSHFALGVLCLAVHFSSMFYLGRGVLGSSLPALGAAFLATAAGWMSNALELANYDNLVFVSLAPALIGVVIRLESSGRFTPALVAAGGVLLAATIEAFPEGLPLLGVMAVPLVVFLLWKGWRRPRSLWPSVAVAGIGVILAAPYLPVFRVFLIHQIQWAQAPVSGAAGNFPGLLDQRRLPAFFALGEEWTGAPFNPWHNVVPLVLLALIVAGGWSVRKRQPWFPWVAVPLGLLLCWQNVSRAYDYGTYKVLFCAGWWIYLGIAAGLVALIRLTRLPAWSLALWLIALTTAIGWDKYENRARRGPLTTAFMAPLRELTTLRFVTQDQPLLLDFDDFNYIWAVYYLRRLPITTFKQQGALAMPHLVPFLARAVAPPPESARFVLVRGKRDGALWTNEKFSLLPLPGPYIASLTGPTEPETPPQLPDYIWIGTHPETFRVRAAAAGDYELRARLLGIGPRAPHQDKIAFEITDSGGTHAYEWQPGAPLTFPVHLDAGESLVSVRCVETPLPATPNGDPRETMLSFVGYAVGPRP